MPTISIPRLYDIRTARAKSQRKKNYARIEFGILCLEGSVIAFSPPPPLQGGYPGPMCVQKWFKTPFIY